MEGMAEKPKKLTGKLRKLWKGTTQQQVADRIGVSHSQVKQYLSGATPGPVVLLRISDVWKVPMRYLLDDAVPADPVPSSRLDDSSVHDVELLAATRERYRKRANAIADQIAEAEQIDWSAVKAKLKAVDKARDVPPDAAAAIELLNALWLAATARLSMFWTVFRDGGEAVEMMLPEAVEVRSDSLELPHLTTRIARMRSAVGSTQIGRELLYAAMTDGLLSSMMGRSLKRHDSGVTVAKIDPEQMMHQAMEAYREAGGAFIKPGQ